MGDVARRAGLTRQAVYLHYRDRGALLVAAVDAKNAALGLPARLRRVDEAPDALGALETLVSVLVVHLVETRHAARAVRRIVEEDEVARSAWAERGSGRSGAIREVVRRLAESGHLRAGLRRADAEALFAAIVSADAVEELLVRRRWSARRASAALHRALPALLEA